MMLRAALSYGESLLELHTLFEGGEISLTKDRGNWNLELKTMVKQLKEKKAVKKGKHNISCLLYTSKISPNTIRRSAFALSYYLNYMDENQLHLDDIYKMKYAEQHEHFTDFLIWLKACLLYTSRCV